MKVEGQKAGVKSQAEESHLKFVCGACLLSLVPFAFDPQRFKSDHGQENGQVVILIFP
jgi:hypothetical protein